MIVHTKHTAFRGRHRETSLLGQDSSFSRKTVGNLKRVPVDYKPFWKEGEIEALTKVPLGNSDRSTFLAIQLPRPGGQPSCPPPLIHLFD